MSSGKSIPVWYSEEDRRRVEEAAVLAGYKHLSKYIRDKSLDRGSHRESGRDSMEAWADRQELVGRLAEIERSQKGAHALLAMLLFLVRKKATTGEFNELVLACENVGVPADVLAVSLPELAALLTRFTEDS
ncbi:conjugal transfer protein TraA (plasmid) [Xanthomonas axonopodis pv. ricini]|uniref:conjugal transfer protein TraA n=1 Tax=Xanthomonas TaxID=338 RepID=UPI0024538B00|nr:conjugal transfer protein TraA [Xanthomonas euvesicatoria]MDH4910107.1 conjugal transfer protein TraA [Xanthomonas euvesicatoria]